jgi:HK97 family phage major capsid protein
MIIKLLTDYKEFKIGDIVDCDSITANELITANVGIIEKEMKTEEVIKQEAEQEAETEIINKSVNINIKEKEKVMEFKDVKYGLGKMFMQIAGKAITGANETTGADGGNLVFTGLGEVENLIMANSQVYGKCRKITLAQNANAMKLPLDDNDYVVKGTAPVATSPAEGSYGTVSKLAFGTRTLTLAKSSIVVPVTSELLDDVAAMDSYIRGALVAKMSNVLDYEILLGNGGGYAKINGDTGYCLTQSLTATPTLEELVLMTLKVAPQLQAGCEWFMSATDWAKIVNGLATEKNVAMQNINAASRMLLGKPVNIVPCLAANDLFYGNLSAYVVIEAPVSDRIQISEHVAFANDEIVYKLTHRGSGALVTKSKATGDSLSLSGFVEKA